MKQPKDFSFLTSHKKTSGMNHQQQQTSTMSSTNGDGDIMQQSRMICPPSAYLFKKHKCSFCDFRSSYGWVVRRHERRKHKQNRASNSLAPGQSIDSVQSEAESQTNDEVGAAMGEVGMREGGEMTQDQSAHSSPPIISNSTPINHQDDENNNNNDNNYSSNNNNNNDNEDNIEYNNDAGSSTQPRPISTSPPSTTPIPQSQRSGVIISNEGSIKRSIEEIEGPVDKRLIGDFKIFCYGPSRCGKSTWAYYILKNLEEFATKVPDMNIYVYDKWQKRYDQLKAGNLIDYFIQGNDEIEEEINKRTKGKSALIIFDDQINSQSTTAYAARLFTVDARHSGKSCIWITQNLFDSGKNGSLVRSIRTNADYITLFKCPGDRLSVQTLSKHMTGGPLLYNIHHYVTSKDPYSYLMVDITQASDERLKFTSHHFEQPGVVRVYVPQMK